MALDIDKVEYIPYDFKDFEGPPYIEAATLNKIEKGIDDSAAAINQIIDNAGSGSIGGATDLKDITAKDTYGALGSTGATVNSQSLLDYIVDEVINKLLSSTKIINNGLCTETGFVADARQLNPSITGTVAARLAKLDSDLRKVSTALNPLESTYVNNMDNNAVGKGNIVTWDTSTESTPYKTGNTIYGNGICFTYSTGDRWLCQWAMAVGDSHFFTRHRRDGAWSGWTTIGTPTV